MHNICSKISSNFAYGKLFFSPFRRDKINSRWLPSFKIDDFEQNIDKLEKKCWIRIQKYQQILQDLHGLSETDQSVQSDQTPFSYKTNVTCQICSAYYIYCLGISPAFTDYAKNEETNGIDGTTCMVDVKMVDVK